MELKLLIIALRTKAIAPAFRLGLMGTIAKTKHLTVVFFPWPT
jgi:hypothetical protein